MGQLTLREYLQATEDAISAGNIENALDNCQRILNKYPHSLEAQRLLGEAYLAQGQLEKAQQAFDWVLTNDPENVVAYCSRALISERKQDYDTALDCYQQAYELSRGNSQIRQEFNALSLKVGQSHFVFSRAGLARLYMRGDLLPQAIQEWEAVLAATPDRLDAQTGLLETYWHERLYEKVEQLAGQILNEVPGCLKALLLLAHVTYAKNTRQAQQYLQLAESLDPDMVMAHELFGDLIASQPADPFWAALPKAPAVIEEAAPEPALAGVSVANGTSNHGSQTATSYPDSLVSWDSLDSIMEPQQEYQPVQDASSLLTWASTLDQPSPTEEAANDLADSLRYLTPLPETAEDDEAPEKDVLETQHAAATDTRSESEQSWYPVEVFEELDTWNPPADTSTANPLETGDQSTDLPAPPAWLEMLTSSGWKQPEPLDEASQAEPPEDEAPSIAPDQHTSAPSPVFEAPASKDTQPSEQELDLPPVAPFADSDEPDEDEPSFGPAWLRSLGASLINDEVAPTAEQPRTQEEEPTTAGPLFTEAHESPAFSQQSTRTTPDQEEAPAFSSEIVPPEMPLAEEPISSMSPADEKAGEETNRDYANAPANDWLSQAVEKLSQPDQNVLTTLEALESDLRSRGFVPLEPGTLSSFAQEQEPAPTPFNEPAPVVRENIVTLPEPAAPVPTVNEPAEPLWPAAPAPAAESTGSSLDTLAAMAQQAAPMPDFAPTAQVAPESVTYSTPPARSDPLLDAQLADLETTMKRPAIHLQPMTQRSSSHASSTLRSRGGERGTARQATEGNLSGKERLLKGYQYQLAGEYDEAMQEYRIVIRNAPELVGEIISNMRALLKIAPKYGPGYRILGDAYMRQGEYLQAMEAYNKALNMTRRAKG